MIGYLGSAALINGFLIGINVYNLIKLTRKERGAMAWWRVRRVRAFCAICWTTTGRTFKRISRIFRQTAGQTGSISSAATGNRQVCCWGMTTAKELCRYCWITPRPPTGTAPSEPICIPSCPLRGAYLGLRGKGNLGPRGISN